MLRTDSPLELMMPDPSYPKQSGSGNNRNPVENNPIKIRDLPGALGSLETPEANGQVITSEHRWCSSLLPENLWGGARSQSAGLKPCKKTTEDYCTLSVSVLVRQVTLLWVALPVTAVFCSEKQVQVESQQHNDAQTEGTHWSSSSFWLRCSPLLSPPVSRCNQHALSTHSPETRRSIPFQNKSVIYYI